MSWGDCDDHRDNDYDCAGCLREALKKAKALIKRAANGETIMEEEAQEFLDSFNLK